MFSGAIEVGWAMHLTIAWLWVQ